VPHRRPEETGGHRGRDQCVPIGQDPRRQRGRREETARAGPQRAPGSRRSGATVPARVRPTYELLSDIPSS
jgi:hypothetical protein